MAASTTRVPLQTGAGTLTTILFGLAHGAPAAALAAAAVAARGTKIPWQLPSALAVAFAVMSARFLLRAGRERASDLLLAIDGLRVEGGRLHGLAAPWREVDFAVVQQGAVLVRSKHGDPIVTVHELRVGLRGQSTVLAESVDEDEVASLGALGAAIARAAQVAKGEATRRPAPPALLACPGCGAAARPADAEHVACASCGGPVAVPEALRARLAASGEDLAGLDRRLRALVEHPSVGRVNALVALSAALVVAGLVGGVLLGTLRGVVLAAAPAALALPLAYRETTRRVGARALVTQFAATLGPGGAACRACGAPLAVGGDRVLARCAYCAACNVVGVALDRDPEDATDDLEALEALAAKRFSSTAAVVASALAVGAAVVAVLVRG